jgi:hypothetical protein
LVVEQEPLVSEVEKEPLVLDVAVLGQESLVSEVEKEPLVLVVAVLGQESLVSEVEKEPLVSEDVPLQLVSGVPQLAASVAHQVPQAWEVRRQRRLVGPGHSEMKENTMIRLRSRSGGDK